MSGAGRLTRGAPTASWEGEGGDKGGRRGLLLSCKAHRGPSLAVRCILTHQEVHRMFILAIKHELVVLFAQLKVKSGHLLSLTDPGLENGGHF